MLLTCLTTAVESLRQKMQLTLTHFPLVSLSFHNTITILLIRRMFVMVVVVVVVVLLLWLRTRSCTYAR